MAELADAADSKSSARPRRQLAKCSFFLCFPAHPNIDRKLSVRFDEVWNGAVKAWRLQFGYSRAAAISVAEWLKAAIC